MPERPTSRASVLVVGGSLAGLAAAARLAKRGHPVELHETTAELGGSWAPYPLSPGGPLVDDAPAVLGFPAPWRDLFRKSGRPLEAELARRGYSLSPADPPTYRFADGTSLVLPTDRGEQQQVLTRVYGPVVAGRWRDLLDRLDVLWQARRPLGLEAEFIPPRSLDRDVRRRLWHRRSLADVAERTGHPHLRAVVRSVAYRQGTTPERAPALIAADLTLNRTFGRWQIEPDGPGDPGRSSVLLAALVDRLALRRVVVTTTSNVDAVTVGPRTGERGRVDGVRIGGRIRPAEHVLLAVDPWTAVRLAPAETATELRRRLRRARPALAPTITHTLLGPEPTRSAAVAETVDLTAQGVPTISYRRRVDGGTVQSRHDWGASLRRPGGGLDVRGFGGWLARPGTRTATPGLLLTGPSSPAGPGPSAVVLSGALATYAVSGPD